LGTHQSLSHHLWGDFTLTADGKKLLSVSEGGDLIQWRPMTDGGENYLTNVSTVTATHMKAANICNLQNEVLMGASKTMGCDDDELVDFTGVPAPLAAIGHTRKQDQFPAPCRFRTAEWRLVIAIDPIATTARFHRYRQRIMERNNGRCRRSELARPSFRLRTRTLTHQFF
jgi:hypothetical protein